MPSKNIKKPSLQQQIDELRSAHIEMSRKINYTQDDLAFFFGSLKLLGFGLLLGLAAWGVVSLVGGCP